MAATQALVVIGGGKMGEALVAGLRATGWPEPGQPAAITVVEQDAGRRQELARGLPDLTITATLDEALAGPAPVDQPWGAVVAVKPGDVESVCRQLDAAGATRVLSIAAGVTVAALEGWMKEAAVVRSMPNTPALVGAGAAAVSGGTRAGADDLAWARAILEAVGTVVELPESALDAVTGLSGSGPAYVFLLAEALIDAGVLVGLTRPVARQLAVQTLLGSARLLAETGEEPSVLRAAVTSPGGTTAAGLRALEAAGVRNAVLEAVLAATERSRQLGQPRQPPAING
jgi:pyrroline-5-carboxylate reductase